MNKFGLFAAGLLLSQTSLATVIHITDGDRQTIQGYDLTTGAQVYSTDFGGVGRPYAIAVSDTNVHLASYSNNDKFTLDLNGNVQSTGTYAGPTLGNEVDGTTDGEYFYTFEWDASDVMRYDTNWENPTTLFSPGLSTTFNGGIAYDSITDSLWLSTYQNIFNYSMTGDLLSSFAHSGLRGSLAFDESDGTLWYVPNIASSNLLQYSTAGALLTSLSTPTRVGNVWGAEISISGAPPVPAPASIFLMGLGLVALGFRLRRS